MTQLTVVGTRTRERSADERLYRVLCVLGFTFYLPLVALRRTLFRGLHRRPNAAGDPPRNNSMLAEVRAEVNTVLAFVFMV